MRTAPSEPGYLPVPVVFHWGRFAPLCEEMGGGISQCPEIFLVVTASNAVSIQWVGAKDAAKH